MSDAANYSAVETLRDGRQVEIRALRPEDHVEFVSAVERFGPRSRYLRFFTLKRSFTEKERDFFLNIDFDKHVALIALVDESGQKVMVGAGRYVGVRHERAEVAFAVIDDYQGKGIGGALLRHLVVVARASGLKELIAEVLHENKPMLKVFEKCGVPMRITSEAEVVHVTLQLS